MRFKILFDFRFLIIFCFAALFCQCKKEQTSVHTQYVNPPYVEVIDTNMVALSVDSCVLIPIGQLIEKGSSVDITIDDSIFHYDILDDGLGGFWAVIPYSAFNQISELNIKITKRNSPLQLIELTNDSTSAYLKNSKLINWNDSEIKMKANQLYDTSKTITENTIAIQQFVVNRINFDESYADYFGCFTATQTYYDKKGVCINFSRVFIALCRAVNIRSRSVSGVVDIGGEPGTDCFFHHQWCEFLDENNHWRSIDLTFTKDIDITNIKYIDFTYCAEETEIFSDYYSDFMQDLGKPFKTDNECVVIYCYYPTVNGAKFGFKLLQDSRPDSIVFEKTISIQKINNSVSIRHLLQAW